MPMLKIEMHLSEKKQVYLNKKIRKAEYTMHKTKLTAYILIAILCFTLCSCNEAGMNSTPGTDAGTRDDNIFTDAGDAIRDGADDIGDALTGDNTYGDGMGDDDVYDMGTADDNGINTNEGNADGGMRTDADNGGLLFDDGADGVVNY